MKNINFDLDETELVEIKPATTIIPSRVKLFNPNPTIRTEISNAIIVLESEAETSESKDYALQYIAQYISTDELHLALSKNPSLGQWRSNAGLSLLHYLAETACLKDAEAKIKLICDISKIDINTQDNNDFTPLHYATINNNFSTVIAIASRFNTDFDARDKNGFTALAHLMSCRIEQDDIAAWIASLLSMVGNGAQIPTIEMDEKTHLGIALDMQIDNKHWTQTHIRQQINNIIQCCVEFHADAPDFIENIVNDPRENQSIRHTFSTLLSVHYARQQSLSTPHIASDIAELPNFGIPDLSNLCKPTPQKFVAQKLATTSIADDDKENKSVIKNFELCNTQSLTPSAFTYNQRV